MLQVKTPEEVLNIINENFKGSTPGTEVLPLVAALGRCLAEDIVSEEYVPDFDRSTVDGYAIKARDSFGCSDAMPAVLNLVGEVFMGKAPTVSVKDGECVYVPTGGAIPDGADAMVMIEYTENYGTNEIGILKPAAPGNNMIFRGDDVYPGKYVLKRGRCLRPEDIGAMAAMGICNVPLAKKPLVGIISTGDELVDISETPQAGQVRNVNSAMLAADAESFGAEALTFGIVKDGYDRLKNAVMEALPKCDILLISGGSSVGQADSTCAVIDELGELLLHGIAMKPGKPTILGKIQGKPVFGLPGHPVAAHFVSSVFVKYLIRMMLGSSDTEITVRAKLTESVSANHGRAQYSGAVLTKKDDGLYVQPIHSKSGLISSLAGCDACFSVPRDCEGYSAGEEIDVII